MTVWHQMSPNRQTWSVYRALRRAEPYADLEAIQAVLKRQHEVHISPSWIKRRIHSLVRSQAVRYEEVATCDGLKRIWFATGEHERRTAKQIARSAVDKSSLSGMVSS